MFGPQVQTYCIHSSNATDDGGLGPPTALRPLPSAAEIKPDDEVKPRMMREHFAIYVNFMQAPFCHGLRRCRP